MLDPDPDPAAPGPLSPSPGRQQRRAQGEARVAPSAPPRSPGNKGPPPPRAGRDLRGQRGAERPDAGGGRRRPRAARFLQVSSPGALPGDRARSAARGKRRRAGRSGGWGIKRCSSHPRQPSRQRRRPPACGTYPAVGGGGEERHLSLGSERSAQPISDSSGGVGVERGGGGWNACVSGIEGSRGMLGAPTSSSLPSGALL